MTKVQSFCELSIFTLLGLSAFYAATSVHHKTVGLMLVPLIPLVVFYFMPTAVRAIGGGTAEIVGSFTWWQGLFVLCFLSGIVWRVRDLQDINSEPIDAFALIRIALQTIVGLVILGRLLTEKTHWARAVFTGVIGIMTIYPSLCLISTLWSVKPSWTFYKSVEYLVDLSVLAAIMVTVKHTEEYEKLVNLGWSLLGLMLTSAWVGAIVDPTDALKLDKVEGPLTGRLNGIIPQIDANSVGEWSAILGIVAICRLLYDPERKYNRPWYRLLFVSAIVTLFYSQTRAAIAGFIFSVFVLILLTRRYLLGVLLVFCGSVAAMMAAIFTNFGRIVIQYLMRGQSVQSAYDVSGRVDWWHFALFKFLQRPWIGYGGYAGGRFVVLAGIGRYETGDILSSWVEPLIDVGIFGFVAMVVAVAAVCWALLRASRSPFLQTFERRLAIEITCVMSIILIRSFFTGNLIVHDAMPFLICLGCAELLRRQIKLARSTLRELTAG